MERSHIRAGVLAVLAEVAPEVDIEQLSDAAPLRRQVELDSMDWLNVIIGWHRRFGVDIPESDYARLTSVDAVVDYLGTRPGARRGAA